MVDDHSLDWVLGDHLSGVAVDALLPFIAVLDLEEIVWQAVLAMPERGLEEEHGAGETYSKYLDPTDAAVAIFPEIVDELPGDGDVGQPLGGRYHLLGRCHAREEGVLLVPGNQSPDLVVHCLFLF